MERNDFKNPFQINRAEHLGEDLYRYFAGANLLTGLLSPKSLVLVGGRGSGKTMFFIYHSYPSKKLEHHDTDLKMSHVLDKETVLGIYFKSEVDLVTGFGRKDRDEDWWLKVFGHFFNLFVTRSMCSIAGDLKSENLVGFNDEDSICTVIARMFGIPNDESGHTFRSLETKLQEAEADVLLYINNIDKVSEPIWSHHSNAMRRLAELLIRSIGKQLITFHVFIDEYENLNVYQQRLINSFIKNPSPNLVFDIGLKKRGFKTYETLSENEQISETDDYLLFDLEEQLTPVQYRSLMKEICQKRFQWLPDLANHNPSDKELDIAYYLGKYDMREEVKRLTSGLRHFDYRKETEERLPLSITPEERSTFAEELASDDPFIARLNLVLLAQKKTPDTILSALRKYRAGQPSRYNEWLHNYGLATVFLLCRDYRQRKRYFGFNVFLQLSSGIARNFLELCYQAFENARRDDNFTFDNPMAISSSAQSQAAEHVSAHKIDLIDTYPPLGHKLKWLALVLGRVFERLHKRPNIGEAEQNHFSTDFDGLSEPSRDVMDSAIMWAVFQVRPLTKIKSSGQPRGSEYHLNHIYAPYFQISYRRKKRLDISAKDFDALVSGDAPSLGTWLAKLEPRIGAYQMDELFQWQDRQSHQLVLSNPETDLEGDE